MERINFLNKEVINDPKNDLEDVSKAIKQIIF